MMWRSLGMVMLLWKHASDASNPCILETNLPHLFIAIPCQHNSRIVKGILWHYCKLLETARSIPQTYRFTLRFLSGLTFDFLFALRGSSDMININATISGAFLAQIVRIATHIQYQLSFKNNGFSNYSDGRVMTYNIASIVPIFVLSISFERFEKSVRRYTTAQGTMQPLVCDQALHLGASASAPIREANMCIAAGCV